jgi:hypothetical protein
MTGISLHMQCPLTSQLFGQSLLSNLQQSTEGFQFHVVGR